MSETRQKIFEWWLERGYALLPVQPGKKYLVRGWGEYQKKITKLTDTERAIHWQSNVAVLGDEQKIILDFDIPSVYADWKEKHSAIAKTYTERTPRGGYHVFLKGHVPPGLILIAGVEIKKVCVVAPSIVGGKKYMRGVGEILEANPNEVFSSLSRIGTRSVYALQAYQSRRSRTSSNGMISEIKDHWNIEQVFRLYRPEIELVRSSKVVICKCPFHKDTKPSFYILPELGVWGCHACNIRGDVINLYARFEGIDNREAISRMSQSLGARA